MSDKKSRRTSPQVQVIRRPSGGPLPAPPRPGAPLRPPMRTGRPRGPAGSASQEQIQALAARERVPARIAKGELAGKMKCRVWRKLHPEEARRFDQVYELMGKHAELGFEDAFGVLQSGLTPAEFLQRKAGTQKKAAIKQARTTVPGQAIADFIRRLIDERTVLSVVLAGRTLNDVLSTEERTAFLFAAAGRVEKLQVVVLTRRETWAAMAPSAEFDPTLAQTPTPIIRQPEKRAVSDPRPFQNLVGQQPDLLLRNGLRLQLPLLASGPFDLLLGAEKSELVVPLHAILRWQAPP